LDVSKSILDDLKRIALRYMFKDHSPIIFYRLRKLAGISSEQYLTALHPESFLGNLKNQNFSEGKSGSFFCFSPDKRFILKTIDQSEAAVLMEILPAYYYHLQQHPNSLLCRIYGLHSVRIQNDVEIFVIIISNLFNTKKQIHEKYDIKGSWVARSERRHQIDSSQLGKDMDLKRQLKVGKQRKQDILQQLTFDAQFLKGEGIMDYSLLVGFHFLERDNDTWIDVGSGQPEEIEASSSIPSEGMVSTDNQEIYFIGLIDILQRYNFQKKMERFTKVYFLRADKNGLYVQSVDVYYGRFLSKMMSIME